MYRAGYFFVVAAVVMTGVVLAVFDIKHEPFRPAGSVKDTVAVPDLKPVPLMIRPLPEIADPEVRVTIRATTHAVASSSPSEVSITMAKEPALVTSGLKARNASTGEDAGVVLSEQTQDVAPHREASLNPANSAGAPTQVGAKQDDASSPGQTPVLQFDRDPFSTFGQ